MGESHRPSDDDIRAVFPDATPHLPHYPREFARSRDKGVPDTDRAARRLEFLKQVRRITRQEDDHLIMSTDGEPV
jgi:hypothetical protein